MADTNTSPPQLVDERTPLTSSRGLVHDQGTIKTAREESQEVQSTGDSSAARSVLPTLLFGECIFEHVKDSQELTIM